MQRPETTQNKLKRAKRRPKQAKSTRNEPKQAKSRPKTSQNDPKRTLLKTFANMKRVQSFSKKYLTVGARQSTWFLENNRALSKFFWGDFALIN